jgi:hypothetical protein
MKKTVSPGGVDLLSGLSATQGSDVSDGSKGQGQGEQVHHDGDGEEGYYQGDEQVEGEHEGAHDGEHDGEAEHSYQDVSAAESAAEPQFTHDEL